MPKAKSPAKKAPARKSAQAPAKKPPVSPLEQMDADIKAQKDKVNALKDQYLAEYAVLGQMRDARKQYLAAK